MKKNHIALLLWASCFSVSGQSTDTIGVKDFDKIREIEAFHHRNLMYKVIKGKPGINAFVELSAKEINGNLIFTRSTTLAASEFIDSIVVDPNTLLTKQVILKNAGRDSLQVFDFTEKSLVKLSKNFDPSFSKETQVPENTFCSLIVNELFKKMALKEKKTYVIRNYNPYSNRTDYQKLSVVGKETIAIVGGGQIDAWKLESIQGQFIYRIWLEVKTNELIKQVSIFPNGAEYWESRIY
ncbi:MAG: hypothetical protein K0S33_2911 [Bacteroidetes bacterium]|jgi:hypothetical protein|nr:hypothetical protein [Bacteroidota bacterium]